MMYATKFDEKTMAKAQAVSLPISLKQSVEICKFIRNRKYDQAVTMLESVSRLEMPIPYTKFNRGGTGHRKSIGPGRYPVKTSLQVLKLLKSVNANARQKGLDTSSLIIKAAVAKQGSKTLKYGRKRGRRAKRTHIEIVLMATKKAKDTKAPQIKETKKVKEVEKKITKPIAANTNNAGNEKQVDKK